jgi:hypothetical protein
LSKRPYNLLGKLVLGLYSAEISSNRKDLQNGRVGKTNIHKKKEKEKV